jgi:PTH1 family peptidyl-tRNA hydrolase
VLGKFAEAEQQRMPELLDRCAEAVETLIVRGLDRAQTALHGAVTGEDPVVSRS